MTDEPAVTIDALGRRCPLPVIELARRIGEVPVGAVVALLSDDPAAALDIPEWCRMRGQDYAGATPLGAPGDGMSYLVRRVV